MIKEATKEYLSDIILIENSCFKDPFKESDLIYELEENPINEFLLLVKEEKVIGFIDYMVTFNSATITQIAVLPEYQRQGNGGELLLEMFKRLPKVGSADDIDDIVESVTLEVRVNNLKAINFYHKHGFEDITLKKHYYRDGEDALYMVKRMY